MTYSRRRFMASAAALTSAAGLGAPVLDATPQENPKIQSGLITGKPVALQYEELTGFLSKEQIRWHHESHYGGALRGYVKLDADLAGSHRRRIAKANSVLLHELYFENMVSKQAKPLKEVATAITKRFGSIDRWSQNFQNAAKSCRGWAMLVWHPVNRKLYNVCTDSHDDGPLCAGVPLVVADLYEHSYYIDFQNRKADYVESFTSNINWKVVEQRLRHCLA